MKIDVSKAAEIMKKNAIEPEKLRRIIEEMNLATQPEDGEDAAPAVKKQFVILVSDPLHLTAGITDLVGWVLQLPEVESVATAKDRIYRATYEYNATKGRMYPAKTVGEALENVPAKFFKEAELWVKTKVPVLVIKTDNHIPTKKEAA